MLPRGQENAFASANRSKTVQIKTPWVGGRPGVVDPYSTIEIAVSCLGTDLTKIVQGNCFLNTQSKNRYTRSHDDERDIRVAGRDAYGSAAEKRKRLEHGIQENPQNARRSKGMISICRMWNYDPGFPPRHV